MKNKMLTPNSSTKEEIAISNLKEAENLNCKSKENSNAANLDCEKECYNLKEINLPPLKVISECTSNESFSKHQNANLQMDEIADTAVSVQTVGSPEASKFESIMKSPGWSRVKQVGKDFRVRKFSRLHVEKNTSNSCPLEAISINLDSVADIPLTESICQKKPMKTPNSTIKDTDKNDICNENVKELSEFTSNLRQSVASSEKLKSFCKISKEKVDAAMNKNKDSDSSVNRCNEELNEMPSLVNKTLVVPNEVDVDFDNHETKFPSPLNDEMSRSNKVDGTFEINVVSIDEMLPSSSKNSLKNNDIGKEIAPADASDCYGSDVTVLPVSDKIKNILASQAFQMQTEENLSIENYNLVNITSNLQPPTLNAGDNLGIESMEVDGFNVAMNEDVGYFHQNGSVNDAQNSYLHGSLLAKNAFGKQKIRAVQAIDIPKFGKEKDLFKYGVTETEPVNVYYSEHAQQTSQRLLDFCDDNRQHKALVPLCSVVKQPNVMFKRKEVFENSVAMFNQPEKFNCTLLKPSSAEKTKVLKRTCLTLEEIQEAFANSNASGNPETICSLPFLFGDFKLNVCVSEETLNISVVKVVETDIPHNMQTRGKTLLLSEKNVQTSNNNSPAPSPTAILPSSNVDSEASQPDSQPKGNNVIQSINPYPYLSEYFSDSEPSEQVDSAMKEMPLNDSEVFPFMGPVNIASKLNKMQEHVLNEKNVYATNANLPTQISTTGQDASLINMDASQNLPATQPYEEIASKTCDILEKNGEFCDALIGKETISPIVNTTAYVDRNMRRESKSQALIQNSSNSQKFADKKRTSTSLEKSGNLMNESQSPEKNLSDGISFNRSTTAAQINYQEIFDTSEDFSSDPDMAYAMDLVAPLKDIAEKLEAAEKKEKSYETGPSNNKEFPSTMFSYASKEKNPIETFEELILSKNKDASESSSFGQKKSRLSLKSKKNMKKFKRIQTCDSDNDSDEFESSKNESILISSSRRSQQAKKMSLDNPQETQKAEIIKISSPKHNEADSSYVRNLKSHGDSLQDNSTFNSCLSDDTINNSNETDTVIEDLNTKILSVVEKLKQCGHENLLGKEKQNQLKTPKKNVKSVDNYEDCGSSPGSEDSIDIFSQSVPPTPDKTLNSSDSVFKSAMYNHK